MSKNVVCFEKMKYNKNRVILPKREVGTMDYLTVKETEEKWGITSRMVLVYCSKGRILGALKKGNLWLIPQAAEKPVDLRKQ